jgi:hypothetical protein
VRYNAELTEDGLMQLGLPELDEKEVRRMDGIDQIPALEKIGQAVAAQVDVAHLGSFVNA